MSSSKRHFTAVVGSKEHGLYISSSPSSAARKIVSKLCAASKSKKVEFCVREITQGSKKKTYGPYLGEMKKLAKPIELKGRVIRYAPVVHLKKKKTATKTLKKIGKKMRGGDIDTDGILTENDFLIKYEYDNYGHLGNYGRRAEGYKVLKTNLDIKKIQPRLKRKNDKFNEPHIFFYPNIRQDNLPSLILNKNDYLLFSHNVPTMYYEYAAFNEGYTRFNKTAKFKKVKINNTPSNSFPDVPISAIPDEALIQLRNFIIEQRKQDPTFCKTIYNAVVAVVGEPQQNE
jgi:hypothetical protein